MALRDGFSNFGYFDALTPIEFDGAAVTGPTIDTVGYETVTFALYTGHVSLSTTSGYIIRMQHASASAAGNDGTWSYVSEGHVLGSEFSLYTTVTSGRVFSMFISAASVAAFESAIFMVGYRGKRRYVRLLTENVAGQSGAGSSIFGVAAILGLPANWPVNTVL
jgi:hypothetical protein